MLSLEGLLRSDCQRIMSTDLILSSGIGSTRSDVNSYCSKYTPMAVPSRDLEGTN